MAGSRTECRSFQSKIEDFLADKLSSSERAVFLKHREECEECFLLLIRAEPSQLFSPLAEEKIPPSFWRGFWPAIKEGIEKKRFMPRWLQLPRRVSHLAALAAGLLLICSFFIWFYFSFHFRGVQRVEKSFQISFNLSAQRLEQIRELRAYYPTIEHLGNRDARLYNFKVEDGMELVMIFDKNINGEK